MMSRSLFPLLLLLASIAGRGRLASATTILAATFDSGVVLGADSRSSSGTYVASRTSDKIQPLHDRIFTCRCGRTADTQHLTDLARARLKLFELQYERVPTTRQAAHVLRRAVYGKDLQAGIICAGWDRGTGGTVCTIAQGGAIFYESLATMGSGSAYIAGFCNSNYREGMTEGECVQFVKEALMQAIAHDSYSGGHISICVITEDGSEQQIMMPPPRGAEG
jgi:20S proteasome subunit beta 1